MDFFNCYPLGVDHARNHFRLACSDAKHLPKSKKIQERCLKNRGLRSRNKVVFYQKQTTHFFGSDDSFALLKRSKSFKSHSKFSLDIRNDDSGNFEPFPDLTVSSP